MEKLTETVFSSDDRQAQDHLEEIIARMEADAGDSAVVETACMSRVEPVNTFSSLDIVKTIVSELNRLKETDEAAGGSLESLFGCLARLMIISYAKDGRPWNQPLNEEDRTLLMTFLQTTKLVADLAGRF